MTPDNTAFDTHHDKQPERLPNKYSVGAEEIPDAVVKASGTFLVEPLADRANSSFWSGVFLNILKSAKVKPLLKEDAKFRAGKSTQSAIFAFLNEILKVVDDKQYVSGIFLDLSKGFDIIDHEILLQKCNYGIKGQSESFCSNGQKLSMDSLKDLWLEHVLLLLYVNDLADKIHDGTAVVFADDTRILIKSHSELPSATIYSTVILRNFEHLVLET
ncbi:uncharacterized protein LOC126188527 [Schistocerca cancellata]|uniref:uncharacterized protein LOC126188527 n=1 Tax=Schistocerca cancellata TaxID=274614 RepID=UPI002117442C|nr:uncharacterized protein LOC126188527 [Schistocerca cancellata]